MDPTDQTEHEERPGPAKQPGAIPGERPGIAPLSDQEIKDVRALLARWEEQRGTFPIPSASAEGLVFFKEDDMQALRELIAWWELRKRGTYALPDRATSRTRRTYWIEDALHKALKEQAEQEGVSMADLVNRALRVQLDQGGREGERERGREGERVKRRGEERGNKGGTALEQSSNPSNTLSS